MRKVMLQARFKELEDLLLSQITAFYGEKVISVVVFGSVARGCQNFNSDIDVLIIANKVPDGRIKRIREFEAVEDRIEPFLKSLQKEGINTRISALIKTPEEAKKGSPLFLDMVEDAQILFDRGGFFSVLLKRVKKRLKVLGARRIWKGNAGYWVLKPDLKPGEVFKM
ncbi:MAG: nucleotidyltransferase domain-containing protein [Thermodesulfobacteriota bacterium]